MDHSTACVGGRVQQLISTVRPCVVRRRPVSHVRPLSRMAAAGVFFLWPQVRGVLLLLSLSFQTLPAAAETRRNHYETLHVEPTATDSQIKKSFRKLALKFHPDKSKAADAEESFSETAEGIY